MGLFSRRRPVPTPGGAAGGLGTAGPIVPLIAGPAWVQATRASLESAQVPLSSWPLVVPLGAGLSITYAVDRPHGYDYVQEGQLAALGITLGSLHETAMTTLAERAATAMSISGGGGRYVLEMPGEDDLAASLILAPHLWASSVDVAGGVVASVATRLRVHLCGSEDAAASGLSELARELYDQADGKPVTTDLLIWNGGSLQIFAPG